MKKRIVLSVIIALSVLMLISCSPDTQPIEPTQPPVEESQPTDVPPTEPPPSPTNTSVPEPTAVPPTETPLPEPTQAPTFEPLPPEPQEIDFEAEDGQVLHGRYYPAAVNPAPVLVLMHWARGDMNDWNEIAFWLQNRGLAGTSLNAGTAPWLTPDWFPPMFEGQSFAVFTFTFRGCAGWITKSLPARFGVSTLRATSTRQILVSRPLEIIMNVLSGQEIIMVWICLDQTLNQTLCN
ncbi:MAG: hypothetical protein B5M51_06725 [Anaerolinea sp. 4484_236]|nr:MAG: hypothetical protein B5M51_06725 [Anaerolinea sp. 4484_236]